jgi:hypothetical protein
VTEPAQKFDFSEKSSFFAHTLIILPHIPIRLLEQLRTVDRLARLRRDRWVVDAPTIARLGCSALTGTKLAKWERR